MLNDKAVQNQTVGSEPDLDPDLPPAFQLLLSTLFLSHHVFKFFSVLSFSWDLWHEPEPPNQQRRAQGHGVSFRLVYSMLLSRLILHFNSRSWFFLWASLPATFGWLWILLWFRRNAPERTRLPWTELLWNLGQISVYALYSIEGTVLGWPRVWGDYLEAFGLLCQYYGMWRVRWDWFSVPDKVWDGVHFAAAAQLSQLLVWKAIELQFKGEGDPFHLGLASFNLLAYANLVMQHYFHVQQNDF